MAGYLDVEMMRDLADEIVGQANRLLKDAGFPECAWICLDQADSDEALKCAVWNGCRSIVERGEIDLSAQEIFARLGHEAAPQQCEAGLHNTFTLKRY